MSIRWQVIAKIGKNDHFWRFFPKKNFLEQNFQKLKNPFLIDPEWSILAKGKVAISKTVATAASGYILIIIIIIIHNNNIYIPTEYKNHHKICESVGGRWLKIDRRNIFCRLGRLCFGICEPFTNCRIRCLHVRCH